MIDRVDPELHSLVPPIRRARGYRLYTEDGRRLLDMDQQGGCAILGHRPEHLLNRVKDVLSVGLSAALPSKHDWRAAQRLRALLPGYPHVSLHPTFAAACAALSRSEYRPAEFPPAGVRDGAVSDAESEGAGVHAAERAATERRLNDSQSADARPAEPATADGSPPAVEPESARPPELTSPVVVDVARPVDHDPAESLLIWRPFVRIPHALDGYAGIVPVLPTTSRDAPVVLLTRCPVAGDPGLGAVRVALVHEAVNLLLRERDMRGAFYRKEHPSRHARPRRRVDEAHFRRFDSPLFARTGPYLAPPVEGEGYRRVFVHFLERGIVLSLAPNAPSIIPTEVSDGEVAAFRRASESAMGIVHAC